MSGPVQRTAITPGALFRMLDEGFRRRRPPECRACRVPLPIAVSTAGTGVPNWRIGTPNACAHGCAAVIEEVARELLARYDMETAGSTAPVVGDSQVP